jgi:hypothetical protein
MSNVVGIGTARNLVDSDGDPVDDAAGHLKTITSNSLVPSEYDYIALTYDSGNLTEVKYDKALNGSSGTLVATLTLAYTGSTLDSVRKT